DGDPAAGRARGRSGCAPSRPRQQGGATGRAHGRGDGIRSHAGAQRSGRDPGDQGVGPANAGGTDRTGLLHRAPSVAARLRQRGRTRGSTRLRGEARASLSGPLISRPPKAPMSALPELDLGPAAAAFRGEVRGFLAERWNPRQQALQRRRPQAERGFDRDFTRLLAEKGWLGVSWPKRWGGQQRSAFEQLAFVEEIEYHRA